MNLVSNRLGITLYKYRYHLPFTVYHPSCPILCVCHPMRRPMTMHAYFTQSSIINYAIKLSTRRFNLRIYLLLGLYGGLLRLTVSIGLRGFRNSLGNLCFGIIFFSLVILGLHSG